MNAGEYVNWISKSFLAVEAALLSEQITPSRVLVTEELLRSALYRGFVVSRPVEAHRLEIERDLSWSAQPCFWNPAHPQGSGRALQHDMAVVPGNHADCGLVCEVKWLKQHKPVEVAMDIWKLALSRGNIAEANSVRTFLMIGGIARSMTRTLNALRPAVDLRFSTQGRGGAIPRPRLVDLVGLAGSEYGYKALLKLLGRGAHLRTPPPCLARLRVSVRARWQRTVEGNTWKLALWEFDRRNAGTTTIPWPETIPDTARNCA